MSKTTFGVIVGNRGFFPDELANEGRRQIIEVLEKQGYGHVLVTPEQTKYGAVETLEEAICCADLFKAHAECIDGIIVTLPNFGEERGVLEAIRRANLNVPILIQAEPDNAETMTIKHRRDSFCGKISICNNLVQADIPFTLTDTHTMSVTSEAFADELADFAAVCRIVKGLRQVRFGAIGTRPAAFNTVRYSEKILENANISVEPIDLYEMFGRMERFGADHPEVQAKSEQIRKYVTTQSVPEESLLKMARFGTAIDSWAKEMQLDGTAIQCWTALEEYFGIVPCTLMSMMSESLLPSACEVDITGLLAMHILTLAEGKPSALLDWNNNYGDDPNKCVLFHCSNLAKCFFENSCMSYQAIIAGTVGKENAFGVMEGRIAPKAATFFRTSTDDTNGILSCYVGEGEFTNDPMDTFGGWGVMHIPNLQDLMEYICYGGFEHHVAVNFMQRADAIAEALDTYKGWEVYRHM